VGNGAASLSTDSDCTQVAGLVLFAYPITAFVVGADWRRVAHDTMIPSVPHPKDEWSTPVAILGTTMSPYLFIWQASEEVEEEKAAVKIRLLNAGAQLSKNLR
jgi:Mn2+/Fe2+ NRAMP family transporter